MIEVFYEQQDKNGKWFKTSKEFSNCVRALNFIKFLKVTDGYLYKNYICDDAYDNQYLYQGI